MITIQKELSFELIEEMTKKHQPFFHFLGDGEIAISSEKWPHIKNWDLAGEERYYVKLMLEVVTNCVIYERSLEQPLSTISEKAITFAKNKDSRDPLLHILAEHGYLTFFNRGVYGKKRMIRLNRDYLLTLLA